MSSSSAHRPAWPYWILGAAYLAVAAFCLLAAYGQWIGRPDWSVVGISILVLGGFGLLTSVSALATLMHWRAWRLLSRASAAGLALYGLDVLLLGHGEDVGGTAMFLLISGISLAVSALGFTLPALESHFRSAA